MSFTHLSREQLATLVPELLLCGHLIDRSGLGHVLVDHGPDGMRDVAIEEWLGASPVYTRRMRAAMGIDGDDVTSIFKCLQLDVGAPPQFMDFRYTVTDRDHGMFELAHCGALMDVEPMGESFVTAMCHDIEDPTFDGTAIATNARAQIRPIHRPPRVPSDRHPHCAWTVTIDASYPAVPVPPQSLVIGQSRAATFADVSPINPTDDGVADYSGPLQDDVDFAAFSHSALVRLAEEVTLQHHLLTLSFRLALDARGSTPQTLATTRKQFTGIAGLTAARIKAALDLPSDLDGAAQLLTIHPAFNPAGYADLVVEGDRLRLGRDMPADLDGAWPSLIDADHLDAVDAILHAVDPHLHAVVVEDTPDVLTLAVQRSDTPRSEAPEVMVTRVSTGAAFVFADRGDRPSLPVVTA